MHGTMTDLSTAAPTWHAAMGDLFADSKFNLSGSWLWTPADPTDWQAIITITQQPIAGDTRKWTLHVLEVADLDSPRRITSGELGADFSEGAQYASRTRYAGCLRGPDGFPGALCKAVEDYGLQAIVDRFATASMLDALREALTGDLRDAPATREGAQWN